MPGLCLLPTRVLRLHLLEELDDELEFETGLTSISDDSDDREGGEEDTEHLGNWATLIPDSDPTVGPSETVTGHPCQEDGA